MNDQSPPSSLAQRDFTLPTEMIGPSIDTLSSGLADAREATLRLNLAKEERLAAIETALEAKMAANDRLARGMALALEEVRG